MIYWWCTHQYASLSTDRISEFDRHYSLWFLLSRKSSIEIEEVICVLTSYKTTFVTSPRLEHSSRTSSFKSRRSDASSSSCLRVNICLRTTTRLFLFAAVDLSWTSEEGPNSSPESHSSSFLQFISNNTPRNMRRWRTSACSLFVLLPSFCQLFSFAFVPLVHCHSKALIYVESPPD